MPYNDNYITYKQASSDIRSSTAEALQHSAQGSVAVPLPVPESLDFL